MNALVKIENVHSAYIGKQGLCRCGCSGNYYYTKAAQVFAGQARSYSVSDDEVNDIMVRRIVNKINNAIRTDQTEDLEIEEGVGDETIYDLTVGKHTYTLYVVNKMQLPVKTCKIAGITYKKYTSGKIKVTIDRQNMTGYVVCKEYLNVNDHRLGEIDNGVDMGMLKVVEASVQVYPLISFEPITK
jgi:hypothetical protein